MNAFPDLHLEIQQEKPDIWGEKMWFLVKSHSQR